MNIVQIRIKRTIDTSRYGALSSGDILRTDAAYAHHLVADLDAAMYDRKPATEQPAAPARTPRKRKEQTK